MDNFPVLNLPAVRLRARRRGERIEVWDALRGAWLVLTPEEWVRRHVIGWLAGRGIAPTRIAQEYPVALNGQAQRADIVVAGRDGRPWMVVECKAPGVPVTAEVLRQAGRYNAVLGARWLVLSNGSSTYIYRRDGENYTPVDDFSSEED